jgi:hypothetical protein
MLPATLAAETDGGANAGIVFERVIVMPDGHRHIEGKTPLQLPSPVDEMLTQEVNKDATD